MPEISSQKNKIKIIIFGSLAAAIVIIIFLIWAQIQNINKKLKETKEQRNKIEEYINKKENLERFKKDGKPLKEINEKISSSLTDPKDILNIVVKLEDIAKKTNLTQQLQIKEQKQLQKTPAENQTDEEENKTKTLPVVQKQTDSFNSLPNLPISIFLEGEFKDVLAYLINLENSNFESDTETLTISQQGASLPSTGVPSQPEKSEEKKGVSATLETKIFLND